MTVATQLLAHSRLLLDEAAVHLVDATIARQRAEGLFRDHPGGVGLVVAGRHPVAEVLLGALGRHLPVVLMAADRPSAVGLAIAEQPDIVLVDDDPPLVDGVETSVLIRAYAPRSGVVVFSDDEPVPIVSALAGIDVRRRTLTEEHILATIDQFVA